MGRLATGARANLLSLVRTPTATGLLFLLPPVVVVGYAEAMASMPTGLVDAPPATVGRLSGALFATAFLAGLVGLFQVVGAVGSDRRLALAGFPRVSLFATRLAVVLAATAVAGTLALGTFWLERTPEAPLAAFAVLVLAGLTYGLLGVLVGSVLPRELEGSLVLVVLADVDAALSGGVFGTGTPLVEVLPLYHAHALFEAAVLEGTLPAAHLLPAAALPAGLLVVAGVAYALLTGGWT
jgi:hypothetical protein